MQIYLIQKTLSKLFFTNRLRSFTVNHNGQGLGHGAGFVPAHTF